MSQSLNYKGSPSKLEKQDFACFFVRLSVTLASLKLLRLGKTQVNLVFRSTFRNFAYL